MPAKARPAARAKKADSLERYRRKRDFTRTAEPSGARGVRATKAQAGGVFVIHKHAARRLHYDLRLEHGGVLWSWAVTRGPSLDPADRRLAVHVEDHPFDYRSFEGNIPKGQYGGGAVIVWDEGTWTPHGDPEAGMKKGHLDFDLDGEKLHGAWHLVRLQRRGGEKRDNWLLIKSKDSAASAETDILEAEPRSVKSGRTVEEVARDIAPDEAAAKAKSASNSKKATKAKPPAARKTRGRSVAPPDFVEPELATLEERPPQGEDWLHEVKFDGYRTQARLVGGEVRLLTRKGLDWTEKFGEPIREELSSLPCESALLDGEIVVLAEKGVSSFPALQQALSEKKRDLFVYFVFDLLFLDGEDLREAPLLARKERLADLIGGRNGALRYSEHFEEPGETILSNACRLGLEGVVSKRADAPYRSGRGLDWIKSKCTQRQEFVIAGYLPSEAAGRGVRSLVLAYRDGDELKTAGHVGTGFSQSVGADLKRKLDRLKTTAAPFSGPAAREKGVVWVKPELVAEVEFGSWTADRILRHASFLGLREDKPAEDVVIEKPAKAAARRKPVAGRTSAAKMGGSSPAASAVKLTNPDKLLWPDAALSKRDLLSYYERVWPRMQAYAVNRPLSLLRAPDGVGGQTFFQKHAGPGLNPAIRTMKDPQDGEELLYISDFDGLAALVQLGVVEIHVWGSRIEAVEKPDQVIFDLDPDEGVEKKRVRDAALELRDRLDELSFASFVKTSGGKGYHVVLALKPQAEWPAVKSFAHDFARAVEQSDPKAYTATLSKKARKGKIFIDYLRNGRGATAVCPYSSRARKTAAVSMPIAWRELEAGAAPDKFRMTGRETEKALAAADPWSGFWKSARPLRR